jgi:hypothetical protein
MVTSAYRVVKLGIHGILDIFQAHFVTISGMFRIRGLRKHHEIRRCCPDDIIDPEPYRVEVELGADGHANATPSGAAALAPPATPLLG